MNRTSKLNKNAKAKPVTTKHYASAQVETATDTIGNTAIPAHNKSNNSNFTSANNGRHDNSRNGGPSNSTV
jgi:hypothetical protein